MEEQKTPSKKIQPIIDLLHKAKQNVLDMENSHQNLLYSTQEKKNQAQQKEILNSSLKSEQSLKILRANQEKVEQKKQKFFEDLQKEDLQSENKSSLKKLYQKENLKEQLRGILKQQPKDLSISSSSLSSQESEMDTYISQTIQQKLSLNKLRKKVKDMGKNLTMRENPIKKNLLFNSISPKKVVQIQQISSSKQYQQQSDQKFPETDNQFSSNYLQLQILVEAHKLINFTNKKENLIKSYISKSFQNEQNFIKNLENTDKYQENMLKLLQILNQLAKKQNEFERKQSNEDDSYMQQERIHQSTEFSSQKKIDKQQFYNTKELEKEKQVQSQKYNSSKVKNQQNEAEEIWSNINEEDQQNIQDLQDKINLLDENYDINEGNGESKLQQTDQIQDSQEKEKNQKLKIKIQKKRTKVDTGLNDSWQKILNDHNKQKREREEQKFLQKLSQIEEEKKRFMQFREDPIERIIELDIDLIESKRNKDQIFQQYHINQINSQNKSQQVPNYNQEVQSNFQKVKSNSIEIPFSREQENQNYYKNSNQFNRGLYTPQNAQTHIQFPSNNQNQFQNLQNNVYFEANLNNQRQQNSPFQQNQFQYQNFQNQLNNIPNISQQNKMRNSIESYSGPQNNQYLQQNFQQSSNQYFNQPNQLQQHNIPKLNLNPIINNPSQQNQFSQYHQSEYFNQRQMQNINNNQQQNQQLPNEKLIKMLNNNYFEQGQQQSEQIQQKQNQIYVPEQYRQVQHYQQQVSKPYQQIQNNSPKMSQNNKQYSNIQTCQNQKPFSIHSNPPLSEYKVESQPFMSARTYQENMFQNQINQIPIDSQKMEKRLENQQGNNYNENQEYLLRLKQNEDYILELEKIRRNNNTYIVVETLDNNLSQSIQRQPPTFRQKSNSFNQVQRLNSFNAPASVENVKQKSNLNDAQNSKNTEQIIKGVNYEYNKNIQKQNQ